MVRVLAADDDDAMRRVIARWLELWGYFPVPARDGHEAWQLLKRSDAPKIVLLDWDMPGLSGLQVCRLLRAMPHGEDVYVLVLTAKSHKDELIEALEAGADDFLSKPFDARELRLRLAKGLRSARRETSRPEHVLPTEPAAGAVLGSKYRLERKIGEGGMGAVWLGRHLALGIDVAIKFMAPSVAPSAEYASFEREARASAQLRSESAVRVYDHGISRDGVAYLVMEYIPGESAAARVARDGALPVDAVVSIVEQAARALHEAHSRGMVHRDVKLENILLLDGEPADAPIAKLIDFGLARSRETQLVDATVLAGTPSAMSPEYLRGEVEPDALLDLWGLAVCAFTALTGSEPFAGPTARAVYERLCRAPLPVPSRLRPELPPGIDAWFALACARDPALRFQSAIELAAALRAACAFREPFPPARRVALRRHA